MAVRTETATAQMAERFTIHFVPWESYEAILAALPEHRLRHTYDRGTLEMMSPGREHGRVKRLIGRLFETASYELDIPILSLGSSTMRWHKVDRGLEPDESYYVAHEAQFRGRYDYDPDHDPPPDLAVEVDVTSSSVPRMPVYAALGVPEVWRYRQGVVSFHLLAADGQYAETKRSASMSVLQSADIQRFLAPRNDSDENTWLRSFVAWVRQQAGKP